MEKTNIETKNSNNLLGKEETFFIFNLNALINLNNLFENELFLKIEKTFSLKPTQLEFYMLLEELTPFILTFKPEYDDCENKMDLRSLGGIELNKHTAFLKGAGGIPLGDGLIVFGTFATGVATSAQANNSRVHNQLTRKTACRAEFLKNDSNVSAVTYTEEQLNKNGAQIPETLRDLNSHLSVIEDRLAQSPGSRRLQNQYTETQKVHTKLSHAAETYGSSSQSHLVVFEKKVMLVEGSNPNSPKFKQNLSFYGMGSLTDSWSNSQNSKQPCGNSQKTHYVAMTQNEPVFVEKITLSNQGITIIQVFVFGLFSAGLLILGKKLKNNFFPPNDLYSVLLSYKNQEISRNQALFILISKCHLNLVVAEKFLDDALEKTDLKQLSYDYFKNVESNLSQISPDS